MRLRVRIVPLLIAVLALSGAAACDDDDPMRPGGDDPRDPDTAPRAVVDRFSSDAATLFVRTASNGLPAAGEAIDFDQAPFITQGLGPQGEVARYYNFDVMPTDPAPIYVLFREGESNPVAGQLNIVDVIPGDPGYNDFWQVVRVTVPTDYVANTVTSFDQIVEAGYAMQETSVLVNCPVVPDGSTADEGGGADGLVRGWYKDQVVFYFNFGEASLATTSSGSVPTSPIFVTFNVNPDETGGGPPSGFMHQGSSNQSHNVLATLPGDAGYSPLWEVIPYDNAFFDQVHDLESALDADNFGTAAFVNCPVVFVGDPPANPATAPRAVVDRFSADAGVLFVRNADNGLPGAGEAIDFDQAPFITQGFGPDGEVVRYYNFDVMPLDPAPIYAFFYESGDPVPGQLNVIDVIPGEEGYTDFWQVVRVTVPDSYIANSVTSLAGIQAAGYAMEETSILVNCPVVPEGSTASEGSGANGLTQGWHDGEAIFYFHFHDPDFAVTSGGQVPTSPIFVAFNINPDEDGGGPPSGFMHEADNPVQSHNVVATIPADDAYSALWEVIPYDNAFFDQVHDLASALDADNFGSAAFVNCPVVSVQ